MVAQQPQEERERFRFRRSGSEGARHLSKKIIHQGNDRGAVVGLSGATARAKDFLRGYSQPGIQSVELIAKAFMAAIIAHHENIRRGGLIRMSELLCGVKRVDRGGER